MLRLDRHPAEILLGRRDGPSGLALPRRFLQVGEPHEQALWRAIQETTGYKLAFDEARNLFEGHYGNRTRGAGHAIFAIARYRGSQGRRQSVAGVDAAAVNTVVALCRRIEATN